MFSVIFSVIAMITIVIFILITYKNWDEPYAAPFMSVLLFMGMWTFFSTLELLSSSFDVKLLSRNMVQVAMGFVAIANYNFVLHYGSYKHRAFYVLKNIFMIENIIYIIFLFTDQIHHLLRTSVTMIPVDYSQYLKVQSTIAGSISVMLRFLIFGFATLLLFVFLVRTFHKMRKQVILTSMGYLLALVLLLAKQYVFIEQGMLVPMAAILLVPYLLIGISIFQFDFLSVSPFAKDWIINAIQDGIFVYTSNGQFIEGNEAAIQLFRKYGSQFDGASFVKNHGSEDITIVHKVEEEEGTLFFQISLHHLRQGNNVKRGSVMFIRDITAQKEQEERLIRKADYDGLTNILNKSALVNRYTLNVVFPISVIIIDIDHFKEVNDQMGHPVGDKVLVEVVGVIKASLREHDIFGRIGGDEFCVVFTSCKSDQCFLIAERIRKMVEIYKELSEYEMNYLGVSIGGCTEIDSHKISFEQAYEQADKALYSAKEQGRNRVVIEKFSNTY